MIEIPEVKPCLVCGELESDAHRCDCLSPAMLVTVCFEIRAGSEADLPSPDEWLEAMFDGLPDEWFRPDSGDGFYIYSATVQPTATEHLNMPSPNGEDRR